MKVNRERLDIPLPQLAPAKRAAKEVGLPYTSLRLAAHNGLLPVVKIGRAWYFDRADLATFIERQKTRIA